MTAATLSPRRSALRRRPTRGLAWVTWRQHRLALTGVLVVLGGVCVFLLLHGLAMHRAYTGLGLSTCGKLDGPGCQLPLAQFVQVNGGLANDLPLILMILPGLIGVFVGAPLVARELESGTFRFAWTQGRSRVRWIVTKLVLLGLVLTVLALAFSALFTWWYGPFDAISGRMSNGGGYEVSGLVFAARTLFGFTLGALLGLLIRRTVPAMAATAAAWVAVVWPTLTYLRPLIEKPLSTTGHLPMNVPVLNLWIQNGAGNHVDIQRLYQQALAGTGAPKMGPDTFNAWLARHHYTQWASYRPNGWFWHFQIIEASGYAILAILLAVTAVLLLRRQAP